ncbi:MAG: hypothetical protein RAO92_00035, partial [Candidatus Euphemobacter frigidus]|nr:hypothetical protein [Candidatus Euphemobacter frigidus]
EVFWASLSSPLPPFRSAYGLPPGRQGGTQGVNPCTSVFPPSTNCQLALLPVLCNNIPHENLSRTRFQVVWN